MLTRFVLLAGLSGAGMTMLPSDAAAQARPSGTQRTQDAMMNDVPRCTRKLGTVSVEDGDDSRWWTQQNLTGPQKLIKVLVQRSGCFNLVDRATGLTAAARERDIGGSLGLQRRSNVGQGQIKAADYVLIAEVQGANANSSGRNVGGALGGLIGGGIGRLAGGMNSKKMEANSVLSLTNVRTTETVAVTEGYAAKNSLSFAGGGVGGGFFSGAAGVVGGGYDNTDIGRIVTLSFIQAYTKLVGELGLIRPGAEGTAEAAPAKTFTAQGSVQMRATAAAGGKVIRTLEPGSIVYPTGKKVGLFWEVADENDNVGWVLNTRLAPSQ